MRKQNLFYLIAFTLLLFSFFFFNRVYTDLLRYTELANRTHKIYIGFQNLSALVNNAVIINTGLGKTPNSPNRSTLFFADSQSVVQQINLIKLTVQDSVNIDIVKDLDIKVRAELSRISKSNVLDSIIKTRSSEHIASLQDINSLIKAGIHRTDFLLDYRGKKLNETIRDLSAWILFFIILSFALLIYTTHNLFRQRSKTKRKEKELEISNRLLKNAQRIGQMGNWEYNIETGRLKWSDEVQNIWGLPRDAFPANYQSLIETIHPEDREIFTREQAAAYARVKKHDFEHRIILPDGAVKWVHQKGKLTRALDGRPIVIEGTVQDITERKKIEIRLKENAIQQSLIASIVNSSDDAIISKTLDGIITSWNKGAEKIFGYTAKEVEGKHISVIVPADLIHEETKFIEKIRAGEYGNHYETERLRKDGKRITVSLTVSPLLDSNGNIAGASKIARDITERKRMEEYIRQNEVKYRALFENSLDAILLTSQDGRVLAANPAACHIFKMTESEICMTKREELIDKTDPRLPIFLEQRQRSGKAFGEFIFIRKGGEKFAGELTSSTFTDSGGRENACAIIRDITERLKIAEELERNEKRFRTLIENNHDIISLMDESLRILYLSPSAFRITGWSNEEMKDADAKTNIHPDDIQKADDIFRDLMANPGKPLNTLFRSRHKKGHYIWVEGVVKNLLEDENVRAIVFNFRDVTERIKADESLEKREKRFRALIENDEGIIAMLDENMYPFYRSPSAERITGYSLTDRKDGVKIDEVHPDDIDNMKNRLEEMKRNPKKAIFISYRIKHKKGHYIWLEGTFMNLFDDPDVRSVVVNMRDITKRKEAEEKLKKSELHYRSLIEQATDTIYITDASMRFIDINPRGCRMLDYSKEEFLQLSPAELVVEEDLAANYEKIQELKSGEAVSYQQRFKRKDGKKVEVEVNAKMMDDGAFLMIARDITTRKNEELQKTLLAEISSMFNESANLNEILKNVAERLVGFGNFSMVEAWLTGKERKRINLVAKFPPTETMQAFHDESSSIRSFAKGEGLPGITWEAKTIQQWRNVDENKNFVPRHAAQKVSLTTAYGLPLIFNDEVIGVFVVGLNKNEEIASSYPSLFENLGIHSGAEIKRKQLEQELNQIFSFAPDIICISGFDGYFKKINPAACELLGYTEEELLAVPYVDFIHPEDKTKISEEKQRVANGTSSFYIENRYITKSGKIKWLGWTSGLSPEEGLIFSVAKDITGKKELEDLLNKVNTLARIGGWEIDLITETVYWTEITKELHEVEPGYSPGLQSGLNFYKDNETMDFMSQKRDDAIKLGKTWDEELQIVTAKGNERWIRTIGETELVNGKCVRIYGSFQDIDQRKKAEIGLQKSIKSLEDYKFALDQSTIISITDQTGYMTYVNENFCKISKYNTIELIGKTHRIINSGHHPESFFKELWRMIESGKVWRGEIKNKSKDGRYYWVDTTIVPFLDKNNKPLQYVAIRFDITDKKLAIENVIRTLGEKNTILESIGDAFFAVDKHWIVTYWNQVAEAVLHTAKNKIVGHNLWEVFADSTGSVSYRKYHEAIETNRVVHFEDYYEVLRTWYEVSAYPSDSGLSVYFKDITYRKFSEIRVNKLNEDLRKQARELAISNKELEQFAYVASHDLQEPLRMITSFLTKVEKKYFEVLDDSGKKYINFAVDGAKRMRQLILDLLEFSKVGRTEDSKEEIDLNELVNEIKILFRKQIGEKRAVISSGHLPVINAYKAPLRQVFQNLVSNALKYTGKDISPQIHINAKESEDHWEFAVSDNGIGIEEEYFDKIFVIFQRLHTKEEFSGTGMGLAITKKIVENLGGNIWVESKQAEGTTFYFTLPKN